MRVLCKDGKYRDGFETVCESCKQPFLTRASKPQKYCSVKCRGLGNRNRTALVCAFCGKDFDRQSSHLTISKSKLHFCSRTCKDEAQKLKHGITEIWPPHFGTGPEDYRSKFTKEELACNRCGYKEFSCAVDIHHIDRDTTNNNINNLIPLCSNCHKSLHFKKWTLPLYVPPG